MSDTTLTVVLALTSANEQIIEATSGFTNPDNLLDLPEDLREQWGRVLHECTRLAELTSEYLEAVTT